MSVENSPSTPPLRRDATGTPPAPRSITASKSVASISSQQFGSHANDSTTVTTASSSSGGAVLPQTSSVASITSSSLMQQQGVGPSAAGSGMAPSLLQRRKERLERRASEEERKLQSQPSQPPEPPQQQPPPQQEKRSAATPRGVLPLSEVNDIEYQLSALKARRGMASPRDEGAPSEGAPKFSPPIPKPVPRSGSGGGLGLGSARFGRRAEPAAGGADSSNSASNGPSTSSSSPSGTKLADAVAQLTDSNWQKQQEGVNGMRDVFRHDTNVLLVRQQLYQVVHGLLNVCDCPRSSLTKLAIDTVGTLRKFVAIKESEESAATSPHRSGMIDHFVEPIATKLISKGGSTSSKFLFDSAMYSIRELVAAVYSTTRAMSALLNVSGVKTEKSKVLWGEAISHCLEVGAHTGASCFAGKEFISRCILIIDTLLHDASGDVRDYGRKVARLLSQFFKDSGEGIEELGVLATRSVARESHLTAVLEALEAPRPATFGQGAPGGSTTPRTPRTQSSSTPRRKNSESKVGAAPSSAPPGGEVGSARGTSSSVSSSARAGSAEATPKSKKEDVSRKIPPPPAKKPMVPRPGKGPVAQKATPPPEAPPSARGRRTPPTSTSTTSNTSAASSSSSPQSVRPPPAASTNTTTLPPSIEIKVISTSLERDAASVSPSMSSVSPSSDFGGFNQNGSFNNGSFNNNSFQNTLAKENREHGEFSGLIIAAADGNWKERVEAMIGITTHCKKAESKNIQNKTALALCDVVALRCADSNPQVQSAALDAIGVLVQKLPTDSIDATSSRWVSCITTALGSRNAEVSSKSLQGLQAIVSACSALELRSLLQCLSTTMVSVRNGFAKLTLIKSTEEILRSEKVNSGAAEIQKEDIRFLLELSSKMLSDDRSSIQPAALQLIASLVEVARDPDSKQSFLLPERAVLDHPSIRPDQWQTLKGLIDCRREAAMATSSSNAAGAKETAAVEEADDEGSDDEEEETYEDDCETVE